MDGIVNHLLPSFNQLGKSFSAKMQKTNVMVLHYLDSLVERVEGYNVTYSFDDFGRNGLQHAIDHTQ